MQYDGTCRWDYLSVHIVAGKRMATLTVTDSRDVSGGLWGWYPVSA